MRADHVAAVYETKDALVSAARRLLELGYSDIEAYTPFPIDDLDAVLARPRPKIAPLAFGGGLVGAVVAVGGQHWLNAVDYPIDVGGRPTASWITYVIIAFELTILCAAVTTFAAVLLGARLPRLHDPVFDWPDFERATVDRFWLTVKTADESSELRAALAGAEVIHGLEAKS